MAVYRIIYCVLLIAAMVFSQIYAGHLSSVVLITVLVLPLISLFMLIVSRLAFKLQFDGRRELLCKGDSLYIRIPVFNRFIFPFSSAVVDVSMPSLDSDSKARMVFSLAPLQKRVLKLTVPAEYRGEYVFSLDRIFFYDILKLFRLSKKLKLSKSVLVMPRLFEVQGGQSDFSTSEDDTRSIAINFTSGDRSFVRKYTDGDDIRRIHWKLSSKQEDYMVWQTTKGQAAEITVLCDMTEAGADRADTVLEAAMAVCLYNLKSEKASVLCCYDPLIHDTRYIPVSQPEELYRAQEETATLRTYEPEPQFAAWARSVLDGKEDGGAVVLITHRVDNALAKLTEELAAVSQVSVLIAGNSEGAQFLSRMRNVRSAGIDPANIHNEISKAILTVNGI